METHFHSQLDHMRVKVLEMAAYTQRAIEDACKSLLTRDGDLAQKVIDGDQIINQLECEIDDLSLRLLALAQPMAVDLRSIVGITRVSVNLERVGDEAVNIAEKAMFLATRPPLPFHDQLKELSDTALDMFRAAITAFREGDPDLGRDICRWDSQCNAQDVQVIKDLVNYMNSETPAVERAVNTILTSRSLERVGDLSTNIAEAVVFIVEGVSIKHRICR
ncbi:phosphate signaling complex protein PhoU [Desulfovibrio subterraneus]|jgi:phosphate transport system protein|uniref:Phosphate-specific transport system accessory protein PhoU n=1 Tax=Desulfovibrio subterraneus TaxID=2718620 RepID=A0A7J0BIP0_9BACT|nr:phosphate signaling complex protein PhoU [Desulfovibrio subterraneus]WBF67729.1 phosphate signaling complex protein PhoU [Desulfovibrio subterraneus]GFM33567.1 phosphate transport system regulatory protein PhoU [Desulfovibrio subterraneus]